MLYDVASDLVISFCRSVRGILHASEMDVEGESLEGMVDGAVVGLRVARRRKLLVNHNLLTKAIARVVVKRRGNGIIGREVLSLDRAERSVVRKGRLNVVSKEVSGVLGRKFRSEVSEGAVMRSSAVSSHVLE